MTFDEAIEQMEELQGSAGYATYGVPEANNFSGYDVHEYLNAANEIINNLRKEYAPTIEMTQRQKDLLFHYKQHSWFSVFLGKLNDPYNEIYRSLPDLSCFDNWGMAKERENELLSAWLHPETIKVIGENDDTATSSRNKD